MPTTDKTIEVFQTELFADLVKATQEEGRLIGLDFERERAEDMVTWKLVFRFHPRENDSSAD